MERKIRVLKVDAAHPGDLANETQDDYVEEIAERLPMSDSSKRRIHDPGNSCFGAVY